jgi:hydrogenase maturation protease
MKNVLVIGYGNRLRSDDAVGLFAVREVQNKVTRPGVEFLELPQLQPDLAERVASSDLTIFIDAATDGMGGEINFEPLLPARVALHESHNLDPESLLRIAKNIYGKAPTALLATIAGECFGLGSSLTPEVETSMRGVAQRVAQIVEEFMDEDSIAEFESHEEAARVL